MLPLSKLPPELEFRLPDIDTQTLLIKPNTSQQYDNQNLTQD
ncbi:hypothetical protein JCM19239_4566 [Vibrio variabilis]|uniref:Uncharacterized protein n=1 Tax=Vibrio variabilis TaxID=990271 RepID=A0ABQ0J7U8_9VIBR|nr:hypothetical protein JCM19239_4566 [Vibrio variabilis]